MNVVAYNPYGRFGPVQYCSAASRILTPEYQLAMQPFVRSAETSKEDFVRAMRANLQTAYTSFIRIAARHHPHAPALHLATRGPVQQGVVALYIEDLVLNLDTMTEYWTRNTRTLFTACAREWDALARIAASTRIPFVLRMRSSMVLTPAVMSVLQTLWRALQFVDTTASVRSGHRLFINTGNVPGATLREKFDALRGWTAQFRSRVALCNTDVSATQLAALCTKARIAAALDAGSARDSADARVTRKSELFAVMRATWLIESVASSAVTPGFTVFINDAADKPAAVDTYVAHFARIGSVQAPAPQVVIVPTLF